MRDGELGLIPPILKTVIAIINLLICFLVQYIGYEKVQHPHEYIDVLLCVLNICTTFFNKLTW